MSEAVAVQTCPLTPPRMGAALISSDTIGGVEGRTVDRFRYPTGGFRHMLTRLRARRGAYSWLTLHWNHQCSGSGAALTHTRISNLVQQVDLSSRMCPRVAFRALLACAGASGFGHQQWHYRTPQVVGPAKHV
jgi:hypothetical protein